MKVTDDRLIVTGSSGVAAVLSPEVIQAAYTLHYALLYCYCKSIFYTYLTTELPFLLSNVFFLGKVSQILVQ